MLPAHDVIVLHCRVEPFVLGALACVAQFLTGKSCSSLLTLLLKTALSLALVRFWCFLVHSIHSGTFLFQENCKREIVLSRSSIPLKSKRAHAHNVWFVLDTQSPKIETAPRLVPSLKGEETIYLYPLISDLFFYVV